MDATELLRDTKVTCSDFEWLFDDPGDDVVVFADPPYVRDTELPNNSKLYEKGFRIEDHYRLNKCFNRCKHKVVLSYDDHPLIRELYKRHFITPASWRYKGNSKRNMGRELVITNFPEERKAQVIEPDAFIL